MLGSKDLSRLTSTSDLNKYADFIVSVISTAVDGAIPKSKSVRSEINPIFNETLALIKEKRRLRRQYSQMKDLAVKTCINQSQKQVKEDLRVKMQASWEKFCNSISLESDLNGSWHIIKNFLKPKGQRDYPTLGHNDKKPSPTHTQTKRNSLPNRSKDSSALRANILIRITLMKSTSS